ncbi:MAG: VanZ family protein [Ruminococcus sp.]|nr:VanZ family protein [Ruminococcus sp.]
MSKRILIFAAAAVLWCGVIFYLSSQPAEESSETSGFFVDLICDHIVPGFDERSPAQQDEIRHNITVAVRKGAHFSAYALLGALAFGACGFIERKKLRSAAAVGSACLFSATDEFHQTFVPGRSGEVRDVIIDTCGAAFAVAVILLVFLIREKRKKGREQKD